MTQNSTSPDACGDAGPDLGAAKSRLKDDGRHLAEDVRHHAEDYAEAQKAHVADRADGIADSLRETSGSLRDRREAGVASLTDGAADQLERLSGLLREKDLGTLSAEAGDLARRHPAVFLGGAVALGFLAGRFLRASGERLDDEDDEARAPAGSTA